MPTLAHADIFAQLSQNAVGGCGVAGGFNMECSTDFKDGLFSVISCKVLKVFNAGVVPLYCGIVQSPAYISALNAFLAIFVIVWGITFLIGNVPTTTGTAMVNLLKMVFVYTFCINTDIFFNFLYVSVLSAPNELVAIILQSGDGSKDFFSYVDKHFKEMFEEVFYPPLQEGATEKKLDIRLFTLGIAVGKLVPGGGFITGLFFMVISGLLMAYINIMVRYLIAILGIIFLLMLTPLFLPAKLFKALDFLFEEWMKMIISFILQIVVVVTFLVMVEPFFVEFMDLIKLGFNKIVLENGTQQELVGQGQTVNGSVVEAVYEKTGVTMASAEKYVTQLDYKGNKEEFVPWFVFMLLSMSVVIYLTYEFMKEIPKFAGLIAGNPKTTAMFQTAGGSDFGVGGNSVPLAHEKEANKFLGNAQKEIEAPAVIESKKQSLLKAEQNAEDASANVGPT